MAESESETPDVNRYERFKRLDGAEYDRVKDLLRERVYITPREWMIARLCSDFRTETGVEMTKVGENLPTLVPFMEEQYSPQAVNQARKAFDTKVRKAMATSIYGCLAEFYTADELDEVLSDATEIARFLLEVEGAELDHNHEMEREKLLHETMQEVRSASAQLRSDLGECPHCGGEFHVDGGDEDEC